MDSQFQSAHEGYKAYKAYEAIAGLDRAATEGWGFAGDVQRLMGEDFEPDAQFLEESWTFGVAVATENWHARRDGRTERERRSEAFRAMQDAGAMAWIEASEWYASLRNATASGAMAGRFDVSWLQQEPVEQPQERVEYSDEYDTTVRRACRLLGVATTSTRQQIKAAYRRMAGEWHPDRLIGRPESARAGEQMAEINAAYRLLRTLSPE